MQHSLSWVHRSSTRAHVSGGTLPHRWVTEDDTYYYTASTMHHSPGAPILRRRSRALGVRRARGPGAGLRTYLRPRCRRAISARHSLRAEAILFLTTPLVAGQ